MDRAQALAAIRRLSKEFNLSHPPKLYWTGRVTKGRAHYDRAYGMLRGTWIKIGPRCWRGTETSFVHEFAHVVHYHRRPGARGHGLDFYQALVAVAHAYYDGDPKRYAWQTEYRSIVRRAIRDGLVEKRVALDADKRTDWDALGAEVGDATPAPAT